MNILIINGSPKKKGGASAFFSKVLGFMLSPQKVMSKTIGVSQNYENIFTDLKIMDVVIISVPLYVDGILSHVIHFLQQMEQYCVNNKCKFMLYAISNSGFVGGRQNQAHLEQYKCWCERAGITWGGRSWHRRRCDALCNILRDIVVEYYTICYWHFN
jgi:multimeric flavodoxin WrbA